MDATTQLLIGAVIVAVLVIMVLIALIRQGREDKQNAIDNLQKLNDDTKKNLKKYQKMYYTEKSKHGKRD